MFHINLSGDPEKGWHGEVHDGDNLTTHSPEGATIADAVINLVRRHFGHEEPAPVAVPKAAPVAPIVTPAPVVTKPVDAPKP